MIAATRVYYVKIWTSDPFPDDKTQAQWAVDSWDAVSDGIPLPNTSVIQYVSNAPQRIIELLPTYNTMCPCFQPRLKREVAFEG